MQDCSNDLVIYDRDGTYHACKQPHRTIKSVYYKSLKIFLSFFVIFFQLQFSAYAQDNIHDGVELSLIYPASVGAGEPFHIYARVFNGSGKALMYPTITHPEWTEHGYSYRRCISACQAQTDIAPGETLLMPAGVFYASGDSLQAAKLHINRFGFLSLNAEKLKTHETAFESFTTDVALRNSVATPNPLLYPVPKKNTLQIKDHSQVGDQLLLHDPNTGYDWIRFELSINRTADEILHAISPDGAFSDFKVARAFQVEELILNHVHAKGLAAQTSDLYGTPPQLGPAIDEFVELIQPGQVVGTFGYAMGAVADKSPTLTYQHGTISTLSIYSTIENTCGCGPSSSIRRHGIPESLWDYPQPHVGAWLVRGASLPERPSHTSSLFDDELVIPALVLDGTAYQAVLHLTDDTNGVFMLAELTPTARTTGAPEFMANKGSIYIREVEQINPDGARSRFPLILTLVPDTSPLLFIGTVPASTGV